MEKTGKLLTGLSAEELQDFFLLAPRVFADYRDPKRGKFSLVYSFSETTDNEDSNFIKVMELFRAGATDAIGICKGSTECGYAGYEHSVGRLMHYGLDEIRDMAFIASVRVLGNVNTGSEAEALMRQTFFLRGDVGIVAPPFHLMRAFMTTVSAMYRLDKKFRVYPIVGAPLPWFDKVRHSQGTLVNTRAGLLGNELERLEKYRAPNWGKMITPAQALEYLDWRDSDSE